jgi:hypothetical protein
MKNLCPVYYTLAPFTIYNIKIFNILNELIDFYYALEAKNAIIATTTITMAAIAPGLRVPLAEGDGEGV